MTDFARRSWIPWACTRIGSRRSKAKSKMQPPQAGPECMSTSRSNGDFFRSCLKLFRLDWTKFWRFSASSNLREERLAETWKQESLLTWHPPAMPWNYCERLGEYWSGRGC